MEEVPQSLQARRRDEGIFEVPSLVAAAHELKSPLTLIRQLAFEMTLHPENSSVLAEQIKLTSERGLRLTSDVTRHARLEDGLFELEPLNPRALCEEVVEEIRPLYLAHDRVITVASGSSPSVVAHRDLLRRILLGFTDNALQYASSKQPVFVQISRRDYGSIVRLAVRDYGPMVEKKQWKALQSNVSQRVQPLSLRPGSSGLGLVTAGGFARAMQAKIGAIRHRDGMTFYVDVLASTQLRLL